MHRLRALVTLLLLVAGLTQLASAGTVYTVSLDGSGDFRSVQEAYAFAQDGDTLYVLRGGYSTQGDVFDGKGVTIVHAPGYTGSNRAPSSLTIRQIPSDSRMVLRGIRLTHSFHLLLEDCEGAVVVSDLSHGGGSWNGDIGFLVRRCAAVSIRRTVVETYPYSFAGGRGVLDVEDSNVTVDHSDFFGLDGLDGYNGSGICQTCCADGGFGGVGLYASGTSTIRLNSCTVMGGRGGAIFGAGLGSCTAGDSAPAIQAESPARIILQDSQTIAHVPSSGTIVQLSGMGAGAALPLSVASGQPFAVQVSGLPGETAYALVGNDLGFHLLSDLAGAIQVESVLGRRRMGALPPSGLRTFMFTAPAVSPGNVRSLSFQFVMVDPLGEVRLAPADVIAVVGPGNPIW